MSTCVPIALSVKVTRFGSNAGAATDALGAGAEATSDTLGVALGVDVVTGAGTSRHAPSRIAEKTEARSTRITRDALAKAGARRKPTRARRGYGRGSSSGKER